MSLAPRHKKLAALISDLHTSTCHKTCCQNKFQITNLHITKLPFTGIKNIHQLGKLLLRIGNSFNGVLFTLFSILNSGSSFGHHFVVSYSNSKDSSSMLSSSCEFVIHLRLAQFINTLLFSSHIHFLKCSLLVWSFSLLWWLFSCLLFTDRKWVSFSLN